jgi:hypothetical protein
MRFLYKKPCLSFLLRNFVFVYLGFQTHGRSKPCPHASTRSSRRSHVISPFTLHRTLHQDSFCAHKEMHSNVMLTCFRQPLRVPIVTFASAPTDSGCFAGYSTQLVGTQHYSCSNSHIWPWLVPSCSVPHERGILFRRRLPPQQSRS